MSLADELKKAVNETLYTKWDIRDGRTVPATENVALAGGGVELDATVLYADLAQSSRLASELDRRVAAKVVKSFLVCACRLVTHCDGVITSFDGDRVMGVFVGDSKNSNAGKCALHIKYAVGEIITPTLTEYFKSLRTEGFSISHGVGADTGTILAVRAGQRGSNDLVWIGRAPNFAARLSDLREEGYNSFISEDVFDRLNEKSKYGGDPKKLMWEKRSLEWLGATMTVYRSGWQWKP
ncbi:MAG: adenylate/guanylate cyclase domain-containing protein [Candidatus Methylomirabilales bacterium]